MYTWPHVYFLEVDLAAFECDDYEPCEDDDD